MSRARRGGRPPVRRDGDAPWMRHVPPVHRGRAGKAWRFSHDTSDPRLDVSLGAWLVFAPGAHPLWSWHVVMGVSLEEREGIDAPKLHYPGAEFELLILALSPEFPPPDPRSSETMAHTMLPPDVVVQFDGVTGAQATAIIGLAAAACTSGLLVPDSDHRESWGASIATTVQHYAEGRH